MVMAGRLIREQGTRDSGQWVGSGIVKALIFLFFISCLSPIPYPLSPVCYAQEQKAVQFFIKMDDQGICDKQKEAVVFALDSYGLIDKNYQGLKEVKITVKEIGGKKEKSFSPPPEALDFSAGKGIFLITDSEPEVLEISLVQGNNISPFPTSITFKEKTLAERVVLKIPPRGDINTPHPASVLITDKNGNISDDYYGKGFLVKVEEKGAQDKSFKVEPEVLDIAKGQASFSIFDSEEESLGISIEDPSGVLPLALASVVFSIPDNQPPKILDVKMDALAFVELTFSEELDGITASDVNNYEVNCSSVQRPHSVEPHKDKVILELSDLLKPQDQMYVAVKNIKDLSGNSVASGERSPNYAVPRIPLHLELRPSANSAPINNSIALSIIVRCLSGRTPQFINGKFRVTVVENIADNSAILSSQEIQMQKGVGEFSISDASAEKVTLTVSDPEGAVDSASLELEFM